MDNIPDQPEQPKKPNKRKRSKLRDKSTSSNMKAEDIKNILSKVIMQDMLDREMTNVRDLEVNSLIAMNQEFLKCFMIVGYDMNEVPVVVFQANSQLQADALSSAITKLVVTGGKMDNI